MEPQPQIQVLQSLFSMLLYGAIGFLGPAVMMFHHMDAMQDQLTKGFESTESYDFIVGQW